MSAPDALVLAPDASALNQTVESTLLAGEQSLAPLFEPCPLNGLTLPTRIVMAPMTRKMCPGGVPGEDVVAYYQRRAAQAVGLIITEGVAIDHPAASSHAAVPAMHGDDALAGWARVVAAVHLAGARIAPQLWHVGSLRRPGEGPNPSARSVSPSPAARGRLDLEPLTESAIADIIAAYASAAATAERLGFDAIELHGAHGYLIDQFLWAETNRRDDRYGGPTAEARTRFAVEVVSACRRAVSSRIPILLRLSQWKLQDYSARLAATPDELERILTPLVDAGVDVFHASTRYFWTPEFAGSPLNFAGWTRKLTGKPAITVGAVGQVGDFLLGGGSGQSLIPNLQAVARMVDEGAVDCVAVGRALVADPDWAAKVRDGQWASIHSFTAESLKVYP